MEQNNKNTFKYESDEKNNLLKDMNIKSKPLEILIKNMYCIGFTY